MSSPRRSRSPATCQESASGPSNPTPSICPACRSVKSSVPTPKS
jgi:hypothetical protein